MQHYRSLSSSGVDPRTSSLVVTANHNADYVINCRERCRTAESSSAVNSQLFLLILVHSAVDHFERRARIRRTWANESSLLTSPSIKSRDSVTVRMETVFVVGRTRIGSAFRRFGDADRIQSRVEEEAARHGDILQGNFIDTYRNMTQKALTGLRWIVDHCNSSTFVMKTDDDAFVNIFTIVQHLADLQSENLSQTSFIPDSRRGPAAEQRIGLIMGLVWIDPPVARRGKWAVTLSEMPDKSYPSYCAGVGYVMTSDVPALLVRQNDAILSSSGGKPPFWIDDVYITGMLVRQLNGSVRLVDMRKTFCKAEKMKAYFGHPSEWYKYAFTHLGGLDDSGNRKSLMFEETWKKLVDVASLNEIPRPLPLRPGRLANCYIKSFRKILNGTRLQCHVMKKRRDKVL